MLPAAHFLEECVGRLDDAPREKEHPGHGKYNHQNDRPQDCQKPFFIGCSSKRLR